MAELEALVAAVEKGELPLEESFLAYEKGLTLSAKLKAVLEAGEARVTALKEAQATLAEEDISAEVDAP